MKKGFTLIELLVVLAVVGILAGALMVSINPLEQTRKAQDAGLLSKCREVKDAADRFYAINQTDPANCNGLITINELKAGSCTGVTLGIASPGNYTCDFTPASGTYTTKCTGGVAGCRVPDDFD